MKARLNDAQTAVLRWLADGQPDGAATNPQRLTARALSSRRLVKIKGRGPWRAELTEAGRHHLEHGEYPLGHFGPEPGPEPERAPIAEPVTTAKPAGRVKANKQQGAEPVVDLTVDSPAGKRRRGERPDGDALFTPQRPFEQGLTIAAARAVMWRFRERDELPPADLDRERMDHIYWMSQQRRRW